MSLIERFLKENSVLNVAHRFGKAPKTIEDYRQIANDYRSNSSSHQAEQKFNTHILPHLMAQHDRGTPLPMEIDRALKDPHGHTDFMNDEQFADHHDNQRDVGTMTTRGRRKSEELVKHTSDDSPVNDDHFSMVNRIKGHPIINKIKGFLKNKKRSIDYVT